MIMRFVPLLLLYVTALPAIAQRRHTDTIAAGNTDTVVVTAFDLHSRWRDVPAAVAVVTEQAMLRSGQPSLVPALNAVTGVRMEERSPGSYRLSLRGSLLRAPFGVRNLKVYWNEIPLTDAGGNTYFNLPDVSQLQSLEVIKGPAASLYGANTGGVVLLRSGDVNRSLGGSSLQAGITGGAYGLFAQNAGYSYADTGIHIQAGQVHYQSDGYRQQSRYRKDGGQLAGTVRLNRYQELSGLLFYTDLAYKTPGGITLQQMGANPRQARQKTATLPGSADQQAAIYNKTAFGGIALKTTFSSRWENTTVLLLNHTDFRNPFITNYETRNEWNYGGRTAFRYHQEQNGFQWQARGGAEWLQNKTDDDNYDNNGGQKGNVQSKDQLKATQSFVFLQADAQWRERWVFQAGVSRNLLTYHYQRLSDGTPRQKKEMGALWAPRVSVLYKVAPAVAVYGIASRGFSPPSLAEVRPSDGNYHGDLEPEHGWNVELGVKGSAWGNRLQFDVSGYDFRLRDAIVRRTNAAGAEYFVNAGGTRQTGMEAFASVRLWPILTLFNSFSYQPYTFTDYVAGTASYSGNHLTGVPRTVNVSGVDIMLPQGWFAHITLNATSRLPLADDNSVYAAGYQLLQAKAGYTHRAKNGQWTLFVAGDNLLNQLYSLGNDINALGGRYYNPAPNRNFSAGLAVRWQ